MDPSLYFWTPRGDAEVVELDTDTADLRIFLADRDGETYDLDRFNPDLKVLALKCVVGFWTDAAHAAALGERHAGWTPELGAAVADHPHRADLAALARLGRSYPRPPKAADAKTFGGRAAEIIGTVALDRPDTYVRRLRFSTNEPGWLEHMRFVRSWCLG